MAVIIPGAYRSPYDREIASLMLRQGDVAARGAEASGQIWGGAVKNLGGIAADTVLQIQAKKQEAAIKAQREAAFSQALEGWSPQDPQGSVMRLAKVVGPEEAVKFSTGLMSFQAMIQKNQQAQIASMPELQAALGGAAVMWKHAPGMLKQQYPTLRQTIGPALKAHTGMDLPEEWSPEIEASLAELAGMGKKSEDFTLGEGQVRYGPDGKQIAAGPAKQEKPETRGIEARLADAVLSGDTKTAEALLKARGSLSAAERKPVGEEGTWSEAEGPDGTPVLLNSKTGQTKAYPAGVGPKPGTMEKNRRSAAENSIVSGESIMAKLGTDEYKKALGPLTGRYNSIMQAFGDGDPTAVELVGDLKSFSALQPAVHGFRAVQMAKDVEKLLTTKQTPATLAAGIKGILSASYIVAKKKPSDSDEGWLEVPGGRIREKK